MSFGRPYALLALALVPLIVALWRAEELRRSAGAARFSTRALIPNLIASRPGARRYVPLGLLLLGLVALIVGAARPRADVKVPRKEATVVLAVDVSRSMLAQDVRPNRLAAAASTAAAFLTKLPKEYSVAVVGIGTRAFVALPPTTDRVLARDALDSLSPSEGTALGDAVLLSVKLGRKQRTSDGAVQRVEGVRDEKRNATLEQMPGQ